MYMDRFRSLMCCFCFVFVFLKKKPWKNCFLISLLSNEQSRIENWTLKRVRELSSI